MNILLNLSEEEYDLQVFDAALRKYLENPISYTHAELCAMLEIDN